MILRQYRLTLTHYRDSKVIGEPVIVPAPHHAGDLLVHDGDVWEVIRCETQLPDPRETAEEAREPIEVNVVVGEVADHLTDR